MATAVKMRTTNIRSGGLRQIDGRIRFLSKRIEAAEVVDPEAPRSRLQEAKAYFGATVLYANAAGVEARGVHRRRRRG